MIAATIDEQAVAVLRERRAAGESLTVLADEYGVAWQRIDKATRNGLPGQARTAPVPRQAPEATAPPRRAPKPIRVKVKRDPKPGPLTERYRPRTRDQIVGQPAVTGFLKGFVAEPYSTALLLEGMTGTGKTSAALALAEALACDVKEGEFGGVHEIASGEQNADAVRETYRRIWQTPLYGSGWKVVVVNEADRMNGAAETIWLDRLEHLPPRTVVVFTTNYAAKLSKRLRDRCTRLEFDGSAESLEGAAVGLLMAIWRAETGKHGSVRWLRSIVRGAAEDGQLSLRRAVQLIVPLVATAKGGGSCGQ